LDLRASSNTDISVALKP